MKPFDPWLAALLSASVMAGCGETPSEERREAEKARAEAQKAEQEASAEVEEARRKAEEKVTRARQKLAEEEAESEAAEKRAMAVFSQRLGRRLLALDADIAALQTEGGPSGKDPATLANIQTRRADLQKSIDALPALHGQELDDLRKKINETVASLEKEVAKASGRRTDREWEAPPKT